MTDQAVNVGRDSMMSNHAVQDYIAALWLNGQDVATPQTTRATVLVMSDKKTDVLWIHTRGASRLTDGTKPIESPDIMT